MKLNFNIITEILASVVKIEFIFNIVNNYFEYNLFIWCGIPSCLKLIKWTTTYGL